MFSMMHFALKLIEQAAARIDNDLKEQSPSFIITASIFSTALLLFVAKQYQNPSIARAMRSRHSITYKQRFLDMGYTLAQRIPFVRRQIDAELEKALRSTREKLTNARADMNLQQKLVDNPMSPLEILDAFGIKPEDCAYDFTSTPENDREFVIAPEDGKDSGALYASYPRELKELLQVVIGHTALSNPMHEKWPRITAMRSEVIKWIQQLFHGDEQSYGLITHGGTGSIIEAMSTYVRHARKVRGISHPEIVVPETAHAAFDKAAEITGATLIIVPVNPETGAVEAATMKKFLSKNTAVMVGSAPSFMYGISDPISELGPIAKERNIPFHVDACLGGCNLLFKYR